MFLYAFFQASLFFPIQQHCLVTIQLDSFLFVWHNFSWTYVWPSGMKHCCTAVLCHVIFSFRLTDFMLYHLPCTWSETTLAILSSHRQTQSMLCSSSPMNSMKNFSHQIYHCQNFRIPLQWMHICFHLSLKHKTNTTLNFVGCADDLDFWDSIKMQVKTWPHYISYVPWTHALAG